MSTRSGDIASSRSGTKATVSAEPTCVTQSAKKKQGPITVAREKYDAEAAVFRVELQYAGIGFTLSHVYDRDETDNPFEPLAEKQANLRSALASMDTGAIGDLLDVAIGPIDTDGLMYRISSRTTGHLYDAFQVDMHRADWCALVRALHDALPEPP